MLDCDNLRDKRHLEKAGPLQARAVVMIGLETYDASEVSEISVTNTEGSSGSESSLANPELPSNQVSKLASSTESLVLEMETSEFESQCKTGTQKETEGSLPRDLLGSEREFTSQSEMCQSQGEEGAPAEVIGSQDETIGSEGKSHDKLGTLEESEEVGSRGNEQLQSTKMVGLQGIDHSNNNVFPSQNTQEETSDLQSEFVPSCERLESHAVEHTASEEAALKSGQGSSVLTENMLEVLGRTSPTFVLLDDTLEMAWSEAGSTPTSSEILDAISQIIPRLQPAGDAAVLQEHSYATTSSASLEANALQISQDFSSNVSDLTKSKYMQHSTEIPTHISNVECGNTELSSSETESSLISNNQCSPMNISSSLEDADVISRNETNLAQGTVEVSSSVILRPGEKAPTDIFMTASGLNSNTELTHLQPLSISNASDIETVQPRSDDILSGAVPSVRTSQITPTEICTNTPRLSSSIQAPQTQIQGKVSISDCSHETPNVESCSLQSSDGIPSNDSSDRSSERTLDSSTNKPGAHSNIQLPVTFQPPTLVSLCNSSLEAKQFKTSSASSSMDSPKSKAKSRSRTRKHGENESPEKREERLKLQRDRARLRRSHESETERKTRREKDRKRQQLKRARSKGKGDSLHTASQTAQPGGDEVEDEGSPNPVSQSSKLPQSSNSGVLTGSREGAGVHCSSSLKPGGIGISQHTNATPAKRPKIMQDLESTNTLVSAAKSDKGKGDLCQRTETGDIQERVSGPVILPFTEDIPVQQKASEFSVLREDRDVTASTTATNTILESISDDSVLPENREDLNMYRKIDRLNNQVLSRLATTATSQTISGLSVSEEDKDILDYEGRSIMETKPNSPEGHPDLLAGEGSSVCETNSTKSNDSLPEENHGDVKDESKLSQKQKNRERVRKRRALETPEQREVRLKEQRERVRKRRANETDSQRETRKVRDRIRQQRKRTSESVENRSKRLIQQRQATRRRRALESPEEKQIRHMKDKDRARKSRESKRAGVTMEWWKT